jgi:hypothetical protein
MSGEDIRVAILDPEYGQSSETGEEFEVRTEALRRELELEFGMDAEPADIGVGASASAFIFTFTSVVGVFWTLLISGKKIKESLEAYGELYQKLRPFLSREPTLDRNGALAVALKELIDRNGNIKHVRLVGYRPMSILTMEEEPTVIDTIENDPETILHTTIHLFEFDLDGERARVSVFGAEVRSRIGKETHPILPNIFPEPSDK